MAQGVILSLGSTNVDVQVQSLRWPEPEETLPASKFALLGGGKAANVAFLARKLGCPAWLLTHVGDDILSGLALEPLRQAKVDLRWVRQVPGAHTGVALVVVQEDGRKGILLAENANVVWNDAELAETLQALEEAPKGSILVLDFELPLRVARACIDAAHRRGMTVVLDPSPADRVPADILGKITAVTPNVGEAEKLCRRKIATDEDAADAARQLCERGVEIAIVKLDGGGCVFAHQGQAGRVPSTRRTEPVDTTGAGDAFTGALAVALLEGRPVPEAARWATAAADVAVGRFGSQPAYPDRETLERVLQEGRAG